jgi:hypothetical protein
VALSLQLSECEVALILQSTTKTGRHDIAEILLKVALNTKIQIPSNIKSTKMLRCSVDQQK